MTSVGRGRGGVSLHAALLALLGVVLLAAFVPAGLLLESRLRTALRESIYRDLAVASEVVSDRERQRADVLMMHAKDLAAAPGIGEALATGAVTDAANRLRDAASAFPESPVLADTAGRALVGPPDIAEGLIDAVRDGAMPVAIAPNGAGGLRRIALAPVMHGARWIGAAGVTTPIDAAEAGILAGLTRSIVVVVGAAGTVQATTAPSDETSEIVASWRALGERDDTALAGGPARHATAAIALGPEATVILARDLRAELSVLAQLRTVGLGTGVVALAIALTLGAVAAARFARPVRSLADAATRLAEGDFAVPLEPSSVREVASVSAAFAAMRAALSERLDELESANRALADRQARLTAVQAELVQRERLAATGRLVTQVAHEIRNPVANVRNCLEVVRRRVADDPQATRFVDLAIDELLRMHELTEQVLALNRPRPDGAVACDPGDVAREVAALLSAGAAGAAAMADRVQIVGVAPAAPVPPDALKQVLLNLVQNAMEAGGDSGIVRVALAEKDGGAVIEVVDDGPGIAPDVLPRVFDPFFTTKGAMRGVGLGLFVAEGIVRSAGGRLSAGNRAHARGAVFTIEFPATAAGARAPRARETVAP